MVRSLHWLLAIGMIATWSTGHWFNDIHHALGYATGAIVMMRVLWGWRGDYYARFTQFVRSPAQTWRYARQMPDRHEARYLGHNPLGGWMVVVLLSCAALTSLTGYLFTTDLLWGYDWLANLHIALSWLMVGLVVLHLLGVIMTSYRHRENLVRAMITGNKPAPAGDDVT